MNLSRLAGASNSTKGRLAIGSWCSIKELCFRVVSIPKVGYRTAGPTSAEGTSFVSSSINCLWYGTN